MSECVFCSGVGKRVLCGVVFRSEYFTVLYNLRPVVRGHVLVLPTAHYASLTALSPTHFADLVACLQRTVRGLQR
eukprot:ANDGO_01727.mRNA.1 putative HIT-like protein MT1300